MITSRWLAVCFTAMVLNLSSPAAAQEEFVANAEVIRSEPITEMHPQRALSEECSGTKPTGADLIDLLHWDLGTGYCVAYQQQSRITGYRVFYQWDEHVFSQVMAQQPGNMIPVRVRVD